MYVLLPKSKNVKFVALTKASYWSNLYEAMIRVIHDSHDLDRLLLTPATPLTLLVCLVSFFAASE